MHKIYDYLILLKSLETTAVSVSETNEGLVLKAELTYSIKHEMTACAVDFLLRRTGLIYFDHGRAEVIAANVVKFMAYKLQWSEAEAADQLNRVNKEILNAVKYTSIRGD